MEHTGLIDQLPLSLLEKALVDLKSPVVLTDREARILYVNRAFEETTGYSSEEALGRNPRILQSGFTGNEKFTDLWETLDKGLCWLGEFINKRKDGTLYSEAAAIVPMTVQDETYYLAVKFDLSPIMERRIELEELLWEAQMVLDSLPIYISYVDRDLIYRYANNLYARGFGREWTELVGRHVDDILPVSLAGKHRKLMEKALEGETVEFETHGPTPESPVKNIYGIYVPDRDSHGDMRGFVDFSFDVTRLKRAEEEKRLAREQFEIIARSVPGIIFQIRQSDEGKWYFDYLEGDPILFEKIGLDPGMAGNNTEDIMNLVSPERREQLKGIIEKSILEMSPSQWIDGFTKDGETIWIKSTATPQRIMDEGICWTGLALEITEQKREQLLIQEQNEALKRQTETDFLTELPNRRKFIPEIQKEMERYNRYESGFCLAMVDLDNFKKINDTYGHDAGDLVLKKIARILRKALRRLDVPARIGGEEFAILLPETSLDQGRLVCERLLERVGKALVTVPDQKMTIGCTCSIGLTGYRPREELHTLLKRADDLLYQAKGEGRNRMAAEG
ncbi:MAG: diguanylate cyclase [Spirochaetales bacterium]|nr:diguanylate cyclase [Spirochaetales bacterium]